MIEALLVMAVVSATDPSGGVLELDRAIPLPGVRGRIDHMAADVEGKRLFVAALGNGSVEVLDLAAGKVSRTIVGLKEPQGIAFVPAPDRIVVACGGDGTCRVYDAASFALVKTIELGDDADNVRVEAGAKRAFVGYGDGAIGAIDLSTLAIGGSAKLGGHPESFQLEGGGPRIFVNVPAAREVAVIDRAKMEVTARWPIEGAEANFPMALDETGKRLLVVTRKPARLLVLDTSSGKRLASVECSGDADDVFLDTSRKRAYVSCGEGFIDVLAEEAAGWRRIAREPTAAGARTSLLVPALERLYLAVPASGSRGAEVRAFRTGDR
jgi:DNA-binding beta-propeller fold protein YncE